MGFILIVLFYHCQHGSYVVTIYLDLHKPVQNHSLVLFSIFIDILPMCFISIPNVLDSIKQFGVLILMKKKKKIVTRYLIEFTVLEKYYLYDHTIN
ncbi:hypothetical protein BDC45DRAFT_496018 [Circinella umbellata]|nr:hypothetical protein BDC45DRAFT_496018 [Circinella umbellata]